mgnify:CR=1 FL=1
MFENNNFYSADLGQLKNILIRRINIVVLFFLGGITISSFLVLLNKPLYKGNFKVVLGSSINNLNNIKSEKTLNTLIKTEIGILKGPEYLNNVYEFVKKEKIKKGLDTSNLSYSNWLKNLKISRTPATLILSVVYSDADKDITSKALEKIKNIIIDYQELNLKKDKLLLQKEISFAEKNFLEAINNFQKFLSENNINLEDKYVDLEFLKYSNLGIEPQKALVPSLSTKDIPKKLIDTKLKLDSLKKQKNYDKVLANDLEREINELRKEIYLIQKLRFKSDNLVKNINDRMENLNSLNVKLMGKPFTKNPALIISNSIVVKNDNKESLIKLVSSGGISGIVLGIFVALIKERRDDLIYDYEEFLSMVNYQFLKRFKSDFIPWTTSINLLKSKYVISEKKDKIGLLKIGKYKYNSNQKFIDAIKNCFGEDNYLFSNDLEDINKCKNTFLILNPGCISRHDLSLIQEDLDSLNSKILGWFFIE